jgi:hypothetical protein
MVIPIFRGNKVEDPEIFLREYKRVYIGTKLKTIVKWFNLFLEFLKDTTSHWFE